MAPKPPQSPSRLLPLNPPFVPNPNPPAQTPPPIFSISPPSIPAPPQSPPPQRPVEKPQPLRPLPQEPPHFRVPTLPPKLPLPDVNRQFAQPTFNQAAIEKVSENPYRPPEPPLRPEFNPRVSPYVPPPPPTRTDYGGHVPAQPEIPKVVNPQDQWPANTKKPVGGSYGMEHIQEPTEGRGHLNAAETLGPVQVTVTQEVPRLTEALVTQPPTTQAPVLKTQETEARVPSDVAGAATRVPVSEKPKPVPAAPALTPPPPSQVKLSKF